MKDLDSFDPSDRVRAIDALKYYGKDAREAVPRILKALNAQDTSLRVNAAIALGLIGFDAKQLDDGVNALMRLLDSEQHILRFQAARALGRLGSDAKPAIPKLINTIKDGHSSEIRGAAAFALGSLGWDSRNNAPDVRAIRALMGDSFTKSGLYDISKEVRQEVLFSLIVLGPPQQGAEKAAEKRALEALVGSDRSHLVRVWAHVAIMRLDKVSPGHLGAVAKFLKDPEARVRVNAARAFAIMGQDAKVEVKELTYALDDKEVEVLVWVCLALGEMHDAAQEALPKLEGLTEHQDPRVKQAAAEAIGKIKTKVRS
jgi:HEAT repeat protein